MPNLSDLLGRSSKDPKRGNTSGSGKTGHSSGTVLTGKQTQSGKQSSGSLGDMLQPASVAGSNRQQQLQREREAMLAYAEQRYKERAAAREAGAAAQQTAQTPGVPAFTNRYTAPAAAAATLGFQQQTQNRMSYQPRSITDRDSVVQGKVYEGALAGLQDAEKQGNVYGYIQHLDAAQRAYGHLAQNQEEQWKKEDPVNYYAYTMSADSINKAIERTKEEIAKAENSKALAAQDQARMEGRYGYDDYDEKKLEQLWRDQYIAGKRIEQLTADLAYYQGAIQLQDYQQYNQLREEYSPSGSMSPEEWKRRLAEGVKKYKAKKEAYNQAASLSNAGYASMAPSYQTDLMLGSAHDQERKQREENIADAREQLAEDVENGWHLNKNDLDVFFVLYAEDPEKAEWFAHQAKLQRDDEYQKQIAQYSKGGPLRRFYGMQAGVVGRIMGGAVNLFAPYSETALELNRMGNALVGGAAEDVKERGILNTGLLAGEIPEGHGILSGKSLADAYQLGSSMLESGIFAVAASAAGNYGAAAAKVVEFMGTVIMGSSAAASDYDECIKRGLTRQQAMTHATAAGIAEAAFEYISLDKLVSQESKLGDSAGLKDHIKEAIGNFFVQGGIEASEEFCTSVANRISDYVLARRNGYDTKIEEREKELIRMGLKVQEAKKKAEQEWLTECINDAIGGFISGGTMSGAKSTMEIADNWQQIRANDAARKARTAGDGDLISGGSRDVIGTDPSTAASGGPPPLQAGEVQTGETDSSAPRDGRPVPYGAQNDSEGTRGVYEQTKAETAEQARKLSDEELAVMVENVEQNLEETGPTAPASEVAVMEGQRDALRQEISAREAVNRNGERMEAAARTTEVPGVDWNDGRIAEAQNDTRADVGIGPYGAQNDNRADVGIGPYEENGGQIARTAEQEGLNYGRGTESAADRGQRDAGLGADRQAGGLGEGAGGQVTRSGGTSELRQLRDYVQARSDEQQSPRQLGIIDGTKNASLIHVDVEALEGSLGDRYRSMQEQAARDGVRLDLVIGQMEVRQNGRTVKSSGVMQIDADGTPHVFIQADSKSYSPEQLYDHEIFHTIVSRNKGLWQDIVRHLYETRSREEIRTMVDAYVQAYDGCYGTEEADAEKYLEEIFADLYGEMRRGGGQQRTARNIAESTAQRFAGDIENAKQNRAGIERRNGPGTRFAFAGQNAETADLASLDEAKQLLADGADSETVRQQTGWFRGMDGKWRFEIDDSNMTITLPDSRYSYLRNVVELPGLFEAYPDLADVELLIEDLKDGERGKYNPTFDSISISREIANDPEAVKKTLVHEIQHAIQNREGFTSGASPEYWERELRTGGDTKTRGEKKERTALWREYNSLRDQDPAFVEKMEDLRQSVPNEPRGEVLDWDTLESEPDPPAWVEFDKKRDALTAEYGSHRVWEFMRLQDKIEKAERPAGKISGPNELYYSTAGEVEARDVQKRLNYSAETRKNTRPDIDREDVVYSRKGTKSNDGVDWEGNREALPEKKESYKWSAIRDRVAEMNERQRRNLVEQAAGLDEDTWRENGLGIKPYSGSLNDVEAILRYVDDAVDTLNAESGPEYYDPSFEIEALPEKKESDSRFSATDEGDSWGVDWIGKENGPEERGSASSASRSEAPSPQGEGLKTRERIATAPEAPRNDNEGNGGRSMSAPTEERGQQGAVPTEQSYAAQAREKKEEIARKVSVDGLKSRIKTAEERMKALKSAERMGLVTEESKRQELQRRIEDTQETIDILKAELDRKKAARSAQKADKAARDEVKAQRKAEKLEAQKAAELRENRPRQARKEFRQDALNLFSVPAAKRQTLGDLLNRFADKVIHQGSVTEQDRRELFTSLYEAGVETIQGDEYYKQIRDFARGGRIYVPQELRSEFGDDWDAFRKRAWGNGIYLTNDQNDRGADAWNVELAEMFPGSFDAQETDSRRILEGIVELAEEGKAEHVTIEEMMLRNQQETGVSVDEQMDELERKVDALIDTFAQKAELEVKLRKAGTMQLVKERQKNREIAARQAQRKKENDTRSQVMKQLQQLNRMRKKSAPEIQRQIDEIIGNLDVMARSISPEGLENLQELARKYAEAKEDPNFLGNPYVEQRLARLEKVQLDTKDISEVIELGRTVSVLVKSVTEDKRLLTDAREREISDAAEAANKEILSSEGSKGGKLREFLGNEHLSPTRMIQRLGGWVRGGVMEQLSRALEDGGTRRMDYQRQATRIFDGFVADKENQAWLRKAQGKDAEWIKITVPAGITGKDVLSGKDGPLVWQDTTFEITPMMRVGLLMHSKNKDNLRHIKTGGIVIPNKAEYIKGNLAEADARGTQVKLQPEIVRAIVKDCTAQERAFAALLEQYYDGFSKEKINEVSMLIDGFERAGGDHYYQIKVSRQFLATQPEQVQKNMALDSIGSIVNERVHAGNPIILEDASTALTGHIDLISKYYGYTAAIRDFNAVMSYTFHQKETTENGQEYTANAFAGSVKKTLGQKWGSGAQKYLDDLLADLQQKSSINETAAQVMAKLRGNLAQASLMANPAVALSQLASIPGAAQVLGFDGVIAGLKPEKVDMGLVEKYSPVLWYRNQGNSTQELGDYIAAKGLAGKLPLLLNWIQKMDSMAIRRLWAGAEYRVSKDTDLSPGSKEQIDAGEDAYYQEVARVFQRAVYDTQPNYSEMQRPAILRSKSDLTKALTMYKTVPLQYYNMMYEAMGRLRADAARAKADPNSKQAQAELSKSKSFAAKTFAGVLGANVTYVVIKALVKGLFGGKKDKYLDEEGDLDAGKIFGNLGKDLIDTYAGSVIFGSEMVSLLEKYVFGGNAYNKNTFEISFLSSVNSVFAELQTLRNKLEKEDYRGGLGAVKDLAKQIAMVCGIPAQNAETYLRGITKLISPEWADRYDNLFDEIERGDLTGQTGRDLRAALRVLMDNRVDGLKDETVEELLRLWGNGQTVQVPSAIPSDITIDNEKRVLTASERSRYRDIWNQTVSGSLEAMIASEAYQNADDKDKARMIKKLYDYAGQLAKEAVTEAEAEPWVKLGQACADVGLSLEDYLTVAAVNKDKLKDMDGMELDAAIEGIMRFRAGELKDENLDELGRLWATGATKAIPGDVPTEIKVNGEEQKLTPEERAAWMLAWKQTAGEGLDSVIGSKLYQDADDKGKEKMISDFYTMAKAMANAAVKPEYEASDRWITAGIEAQKMGVPMDEYVLCHEQLSGASSAKNKIQILKQQGWDDRQKEKVWLEALASETQAKKYENLKNGGASWADAMTVMDIGGDATEGLTEAQTKVYNQRWEEITANTTKRLMQTQAYKKATAEEKEALVDKLNTYASAVAKAEAAKTASKEAWVNAGVSATKAGVKLEDYIVFTNQLSKIDGKDENGESVDGLARNRELALLNATGWTDKQKEIVFLESGMTDKESENKERALRNAGLTWMQTSDVMGTVGSTTDKAYAVINSGASDDVVYKALEVYLNGSTLRTAQVGINYRVDLKYWASARKEASTDGNNSVSQEEATVYIDNLNLGWEDKAYLWQMVCYSSKWMKNPYSTTLGKDIWYSLHPEG